MDQVQHVLTEENFDILMINETWLNSKNDGALLEIPGYTFYRKDRKNQAGGGVGAYVKESANLIYRQDISEMNDVEQIWFESELKPIGQVLIGTIYRPPNSREDYFDKILDVMDCLSSEGKEIVLAGDLNFNCNSEDHNKIKTIKQMYSMEQIVKSATRSVFKQDSKTGNLTLIESLIDVILTTCNEFHRNTNVKEYNISDHKLVKTQLYAEVLHKHQTVTYRNYKYFNEQAFINELKNSDILQNINSFENTQDAWQAFKDEFTRISNNHAPLRSSRLKIRKNPWIDKEILEMMYKRDGLYKKAKKTKDPNDYRLYRSARNNVTSMIRLKKTHYFETSLTNANGDSATIWKILEQVLPKRKFSQLHTSLTSDELLNHFASVGDNISATFGDYKSTGTDTVKGESIYKFEIPEITQTNIEQKLQKLPNYSSLDILNFDTKLLNLAYSHISQPLSDIYNMSLKDQVVINDWKLARVTPVYKGKGSFEDPSSYRPIASVGHLAKVLEKTVNDHLMSYLIKHQFISIDQFAYQKHNSTQTAVHRIVEDLLEAHNEGEYAICCFLDISKCYDTIHHGILFKKLEKYGIKDSELNWIKSYVQNRSFKVNFNRELSKETSMNIGLPQGSTLGPTLFLLFTNDLSQALNEGNLNMYADDAGLYVMDKNEKEAKRKMQVSLDMAAKWYKENRLQLNENKCYIMLIGSKFKDIDCNFYLNDKVIQKVDSVTYLGLIFDNKLTFQEHADYVVAKGKSKLSCLRKLAKILPEETLCNIYQTKIEPAIDYLGTVWGHTSSTNSAKGQRTQNMAARIIKNNYDFINTRGLDLVYDLKWRDFQQRQQYYNAVLTYKAIHGLVSQHLCNLILFEFETHNHETRGALNMDLAVPMVKKEMFRNSFQYHNINIWNNLPHKLKNAITLDSFKSMYKHTYFNQR